MYEPVLFVRKSSDIYPIYRHHWLGMSHAERVELFWHAPWMAGHPHLYHCRCTICWVWARLARREVNELRAKYGHPPVRESWAV